MNLRVNVGLDVGMDELVLVAKKGEDICLKETFKNTSTGHKALINSLKKLGKKIRITLEATGSYSFDIVYALNDVKNFELMVVNPASARNFAKSLMNRSKTDLVDAEMLAEYSARMPFKQWEKPKKECHELRCITRRISSLKKQITQEKNRLHTSSSSKTIPEIIKKDIHQAIQQFEKRIKSLEKAAKELIENSKELKQQFELLLTVPGIGEVSGLMLLGEICLLPPELGVKQWVAYMGLDPAQERSGKISKRDKISKKGNMHLRRDLYFPALSAIRNDKNVKAFYDKLVEKGKKKMQAVVAVMRKRIHTIYGLFKNLTPYDPNKFFQIPEISC